MIGFTCVIKCEVFYMKIYSINSYQQNYATKNIAKNRQQVAEKTRLGTKNPSEVSPAQVAFKGDTGAALGVVAGAATGAAIVGITILTGGLAPVVAAIGTTGALVTGAAAGTHIGGIIGGIVEDKMNK